MKVKYQKISYYCMVIFTMLLLSACSQNDADPREKEVVQLVVNEKYDEAIQRANELYEGQELEDTIQWINKYSENDNVRQEKINEVYSKATDILEIQQNHLSKIQNDYIYITGRVKNVSNDDINYFEVKCDFLDKNDQVLDSDYTNDNLVLKPGEMRDFEIMHRYKDEYEKYELLIGDVK